MAIDCELPYVIFPGQDPGSLPGRGPRRKIPPKYLGLRYESRLDDLVFHHGSDLKARQKAEMD